MPEPAGQAADIDRLIAETQQLLVEIGERIAPLAAEQARAQERLRLLKDLRSTFPEHVVADDAGRKSAEVPAVASPLTRDRVRACVTELLETTGPMHINDIHRLFLERGWPIPGAGRPGNISAHLTTAAGIYSPRRGYWALGESPAPPRQGARRRKKSRSRPSQTG